MKASLASSPNGLDASGILPIPRKEIMSQKPLPQGPFGHWHELYEEPELMPWRRPSKAEGIVESLDAIGRRLDPPELIQDKLIQSLDRQKLTGLYDVVPPSESGLTPGFSGASPLPDHGYDDSILWAENLVKGPAHDLCEPQGITWVELPTEPTGDSSQPFYPGPRNATILDEIRKAQCLYTIAMDEFYKNWKAVHPLPIQTTKGLHAYLEARDRQGRPLMQTIIDLMSCLSPSYLRYRADTPGNPLPREE